MHSIALIEPSPTLRFGINKQLQACHYNVTTFSNLVDFEQSVAQQSNRFQVLVVGWPTRSFDEQIHCISALNSEPLSHLPCLILSRSMTETHLEQLNSRPNTAVELWKNYQECINTLQRLIESAELKPDLKTHSSIKLKALLVDDSRSARVLFSKTLEKLGLEVSVAEDADKALIKLDNEHFDLAIIDYFMPGKTGEQLCQIMTQSSEHAHIVKAILTGSYQEEIIAKCIQSGATECMFKNESMDLFKIRVQSMIHQIITHRSIHSQKLYFENILSSIGEGIFGVDGEGKLTFVNPMALKILGYEDQQSLIGQFAHKIIHGSDEYGRKIPDEMNYLFQAYLLKDSLLDWETIFWSADHRPMHVECSVQQQNTYIEGIATGSVVVFRNISERKLLEDELNWQLNHDYLTQLLNRAYFEQLLKQEMHSLQFSKSESALLFIDLDNFKFVNDEAGHAKGDQLLVQIGEKIRARLRHRDLAARLGGDEFAILLHDTNKKKIEDLANSYREILEGAAIEIQGRPFSVSGSIGVTILNEHSNDHELLLEQADVACKQAKAHGKNCVQIFQSIESDQSKKKVRPGWRTKIERALEKNEFQLLAQPIFKLSDVKKLSLKSLSEVERFSAFKSLRATEFELFLRLSSQSGENILPNQFLSDAERFDLISNIDIWVLEFLAENGSNPLFKTIARLNLNFSAHTLLDKTRVESIAQLINQNDHLKHRVNIEIKEHHLIHYREQLLHSMEQLVQVGCQFIIDDFGRNFSLFSMLRKLPIAGVKIDGVFTQNISWDPVDKKLMHSMAEVARSASIKSTAKSVESYEALFNIEKGGFDLVQGYYLAHPEKFG